ncbi:MAG: class I SAM-dependent methyltransferase [Gammaproteobacteria bacterium]|nr:class I SAM-dependent methyltransferase [Gammaproteobacteria bacterium]
MSGFKVRKDLVSNYEDYYAAGDSEWRRLGALDKSDNIVSLCKRLKIKSVIEIGAGEGAVLQQLSIKGFSDELYGIDISETGVDTIRKKNIPGLIECMLYDGYSIPYEDEKFDLAILSHVVEHLEHPRQLIYEARRIAKYVLVEVPLEDNSRLPLDFVFDKVGHINFYSPKTIRRLLQSCNLNVIDQKVTAPSKAVHTFHNKFKGLVGYYIKNLFLKLFPKIAPSIFTYHSTLICQKS